MPGKRQYISSRLEYYRDYYMLYNDRYKYAYYDKKIKEQNNIALFEKYNGERAYYENYYKDFCNKK
jgi:hypothetical protein